MLPVKYWKSLLDNLVVKGIRETAVGITDRFAIELESMGMDQNHIHLLHGKSFAVIHRSSVSCGVVSFGQMAIMWPRWDNEEIGKWWNGMWNNRDSPSKTFNSSSFFNTP